MLREKGIIPEVAAGLSLGEYSALQAAGAFDSKTAVELVAFRGKAMAQAVQDRPCGMARVLMLGREQLAECCRQAGEAGCGGDRPTTTAPPSWSSPGTPPPWRKRVSWPSRRGPSGWCR